MAEIVRMPKLSDTMVNGVVSKWHKKIGDSVEEGDLLADIETDKATMEFESFQDGELLYIGVKDGETAPVNSILAILGEKGEDVDALIAAEEKESKEEVKEEAPTPKQETPVVVNVPIETSEPVSAPVTSLSTIDTDHIKVSPLAKRIAKEKGINIQLVNGTGEGGRIIKRDIDNFQFGNSQSNFVGTESFTEVPVSQMRSTIAQRLSASKFTAPHFYLTMEINMDRVMGARTKINTVATSKVSFNDIIIKAVGMSLRKHPNVNASWLGDKIRYNNHIHIGVAVAVEDGLLVPVVRFAETKTLSQISSEVKTFAAKAADKKLQPADWAGNTFTISNLGMFGIDQFTAIINSPDACILAVGGIKEVPVVKNGQIVPGNIMKVTLSCDHRVVDGATGAAFLQTLKENLESPILMLGSQSI